MRRHSILLIELMFAALRVRGLPCTSYQRQGYGTWFCFVFVFVVVGFQDPKSDISMGSESAQAQSRLRRAKPLKGKCELRLKDEMPMCSFRYV